MPKLAVSWSLHDTIALLAVTGLACVVRSAHVTSPSTLVFDEDYYARDACTYVETSKALCGAAGEVTTMHPPLGKWLIAGGIDLIGFDPLGWRVAPVIAGVITVPLLYLLARRLIGSTLAATVASGALAIDFLHVVMSRVAMLDVFVTLFGTATALFLVVDRDFAFVRSPLSTGGRFWRPWRAAAGFVAGAAVASKWSGLLVLASALVLTAAWEIARRRPERYSARRALRDEWASVGCFLLVLPLLVYAATYYRRLDATFLAVPGAREWWPRAFAGQQLEMLRFNAGLRGDHVYESPAWSWLLLKRPVGFYFEAAEDGYIEILALGNPVTWWLAVTCVAYAAICLARFRSARSPALVVVVFAAMTYLPWVLVSAGRDVEFLYYLLPTVPFLCLALGFGAEQLVRRLRTGRAIVFASAAVAAATFAFYYPLLTARPLPYPAWKERILFEHCAREDGTLVPRVRDGRIEPRLGAGKPPTGWCWI